MRTLYVDEYTIKDYQDFIDCLESGNVPKKTPKLFEQRCTIKSYDKYFYMRGEVTDYGMWALVDLQWTKKLANWIDKRIVLEVMAGRGWLAKALHHHGVNVIATDNYDWEEKHEKGKMVFDIERLDALDAVKQYPNADILIVSWPPYEHSHINKVCAEWGKTRPIVYIGEGYGGCTADNEFHKRFEETQTMSIPQWDGIHDHIEIGYYK